MYSKLTLLTDFTLSSSSKELYIIFTKSDWEDLVEFCSCFGSSSTPPHIVEPLI